MNSSSVLLFAFFAIVAFAAIGMILYNRQRIRADRTEYLEPKLGMTVPIKNTKAALSKLDETIDDLEDQAQKSEDMVYDPIVGDFVSLAPKNVKPIAKSKSPANRAIHSEEIIVLMLLARRDRPYVGYELLQALLSAGLRFGKMNIFHRYHQTAQGSGILFSLASAVEPGTFEMSKMGGFSSAGLTLFMRTSDSEDPLLTFDLMLETAKQLVEDLGGEVYDGKREPLTEEKIAELRMRLLSLEEAQQSEDLFVA